MARAKGEEQLADYERRYRELSAQLAEIGLISSGSVTHRYTHCATPGCKCHGDPPQRHGPYYQWTAKVGEKRSPDGSAPMKPGSTRNGSPTTATCAVSSPRCAK
jgi:hypothetical protein